MILTDTPNVAFYFDNIFIFSKSWKEHVQTIKVVLLKLRDHGLTANPSKCRFGCKEIKYLGFIISENSLVPQLDKLKSINELPEPKTKKTLRSFLGMTSFYRRFIPDAATITAPLTSLLSKETKEPLQFNPKAKLSFEKLKHCLTRHPILRLPDINRPFVVRSDASNIGLGAVLLQYDDDTPYPIAYASRKLTSAEQNYSTIERECLGIIFAINKFRYYLLGSEFILEIDHKPLIYLSKVKGSNARLLRWSLNLQPYKFRIVHIPGIDNVGADLCSRSHA